MGGNGGGEKGGGNYDAETSWLTRTASALAMHAMEEKGRSWLASRSSATNFRPHSTDDDQNDDLTSPASREVGGEGNVSPVVYTRSAPHSRFASRTQSRVGSRAGSRVDVRMMRSQVGLSSMPMGEEGPGFAKRVVGIEGIEPDFVDLDEKDEEKVEGVDEGEMRRLVMGRVGGWVDWMVGWMDWRGDDGEEEGEEDGEDEGMEEGQGRQEVVEDTVMGKKERGVDDGTRLESGVSIPPAPEAAGRAWDDAKWLLKIAAESL